MRRRTVGLAQVKDLTTIANEEKRMCAERIVILVAKVFIKNRNQFKTGKQYVDNVKKIAQSI